MSSRIEQREKVGRNGRGSLSPAEEATQSIFLFFNEDAHEFKMIRKNKKALKVKAKKVHSR